MDDRSKEEGHEMCKILKPSGGQPLESRMRSKVQVRFGGSQTEKEQPCHLAGWLPYSENRYKILREDQHGVKKSERAAFNFILSQSARK